MWNQISHAQASACRRLAYLHTKSRINEAIGGRFPLQTAVTPVDVASGYRMLCCCCLWPTKGLLKKFCLVWISPRSLTVKQAGVLKCLEKPLHWYEPHYYSFPKAQYDECKWKSLYIWGSLMFPLWTTFISVRGVWDLVTPPGEISIHLLSQQLLIVTIVMQLDTSSRMRFSALLPEMSNRGC